MKNILKSSLAVFLLIGISFTASAQSFGNWKHIHLKSKEGTEISLDYKTLEYGYYGSVVISITELWLHVNRSDLGPQDAVRVLIMNHPFYSPELVQTTTYDLNYADENHFILGSDYQSVNIFNARQELAVVINGQWQTLNLESNEANIEFRMVPYIRK